MDPMRKASIKAVQTGRTSSSSHVASFISMLCESRVEVVHFPGELTTLALPNTIPDCRLSALQN